MELNFSLILNVLFPLTDDEKNIAHVTESLFRSKLQIEEIRSQVLSLSSFKDATVRSAIHLVKFHHHPRAAKLLASLLSAYIAAYVQQETIIIPIPLSQKRERKRGHNQVYTVAKRCMTQHQHIQIRTDLLIKTRDTLPQSSLPLADRKQNVKGVFALTPKAHAVLANKHVIVLDDVVTTGTTLLQAKSLLEKASPISLLCVALAH